MSLRVLATLLITFVGIPASFFNAFYGLLTYAFYSYVRPEEATWGLLPIDRLSYIAGLVLVVTTLMQEKRLFTKNSKNSLIVLFWVFVVFSAFLVAKTDIAHWQFRYFTRVILVTLVITLLVNDPKRFRQYLWVIAIFIGMIAAQAGIKGTLMGEVGGASSGYVGLVGGRGGRAFTAVFLCSILPVVYYLKSVERNKWLKLILQVTFFGDILAIILTYSRAGFLGLAAMGLFVVVKSKRKVLSALLIALYVFVLVSYVIPPEYIGRIKTIKQYDIEEENVDMSAAGRLIAWRSAIEMIKDNPILGVGFYSSSYRLGDYPDPKTGLRLSGKAIHNSVLQVASELGLPALFLFIFIFFINYRSLGKIRRACLKHNLPQEYWDYASMLQICFVGYFSTGFFVNTAFIDIPWHLVGLTIALERIAGNEIAAKAL